MLGLLAELSVVSTIGIKNSRFFVLTQCTNRFCIATAAVDGLIVANAIKNKFYPQLNGNGPLQHTPVGFDY